MRTPVFQSDPNTLTAAVDASVSLLDKASKPVIIADIIQRLAVDVLQC